jgi:phage terminase Nu1 subunit (DNA packaging protein)
MANQKTIAAWLDLSDKQVRNLQGQGVLPKARGRGQLDEKTCVIAYINYLRARKGIHVNEDEDEEKKENPDDRLKRLRADSLEFKLQIEQTKWVPIDLIDTVLNQAIDIILARLGALPAKIRMTSPDLRPSAIALLTKEINLVQDSCTHIEIPLPDYDDCDYAQAEAFVLAAEDDST